MENQTIDVTKITDLELMKVSMELNNQIAVLQGQYNVVINEYNARVKAKETKPVKK